MEALKATCPFELEEVNLWDQPQLAMEHGFLSTPAIIIEGQLAFAGRVPADALRHRLLATAAGPADAPTPPDDSSASDGVPSTAM